jgi:ADP-ribose pyrophosphatase YjhB (NUDIX family)
MIQGAAFRILACFVYENTRSFSELCSLAGYPTDLGGYYIRQLVGGEYLKKIERGQYRILPKGKYLLTSNYGKKIFVSQPRLHVALVVRQGGKLIVQRRTAQPFIGVVEWPAGKIRAGEMISDAAARLAKERFGVSPELHMHGLFRRVDFYNDDIFDDKLFAIHSCDLPVGLDITSETRKGKNGLYPEDELRQIEKPGKSLFDIIDYVKSGSGQLQERVYKLTANDLNLDELEMDTV